MTYVPNIKLAVKNGHRTQTFRDIYMSLKSKLEKANGKFAFFLQLKQVSHLAESAGKPNPICSQQEERHM